MELNTHIIYAGQYYFDFEVLQRINNNFETLTLTLVYMYRDLLMILSKKKRWEQFYRGESYRQVNHLTPTGNELYQNSTNDDLESFFGDIEHGRNPLPMAWTYSISRLTEAELEFIENQGRFLEDFYRTFRSLDDANIEKIMIGGGMRASHLDSLGKFFSAFCRRKTISIKSERRRGQRKFILDDKEEESQYGSTEDTIALIKTRKPFYPLLGNA